MERALRARVLLAEVESLGLNLDDLAAAAAAAPAPVATAPTVSEYVERILPTFTRGTRRTYGTYLRLAQRVIGARPLNTVSTDDCEAVVLAAAERAMKQRPGTDARSPRENCVAALRALFERARRARLISDNPAAEVSKPRRLESLRRGLDTWELEETWEAVKYTSRDPELDLLVCEFHLVAGARQEGALNLVLDGIDERRSTL